MPHAHAHHEDLLDVWSVEGRFHHLVYSPKGAIEGLLIDTDGVPTQFVADPHDPSVAEQFTGLREGQALVIEGTEAGPSPKGEALHTVYRFERLVSVDGKPPKPARPHDDEVTGTVVRFNYARHGAANGVVLDSGDFIHTRPEGMERLGLKIGDKVRATGEARPLVTGAGRVVEARSVNGTPVGPAH
ncbi:hypothetical protein [Variovorax sp. dw_308]|uniref:hypothetical protein n=1 Tax=Variovorax sp. dw_308 TaxID=2721546 RepID=UPI001C45AB4E|nr:hypothetical protein [Variovorax sp. dw_308]